jgi:hypothetical protein
MRIFDDSIESLIIDSLRAGKMSGPELVLNIEKKRPKTTKQAVYLAMRTLLKDEVVVHFKKKYSISDLFLDKVIGYFNYPRSKERQKLNTEPFLSLSDGDSIAYSFKTPYVTDQFWAHAVALLTSYIPKEIPIIIYDPHEWFIYARFESEKRILNSIISQKKYIFFTIGSTTPADIYAKKYFQAPHVQYFTTTIDLPRNYYINIFDDYIIEVWLDTTITKNIDEWYIKTKEVNPDEIKKLESIVQSVGRTKMRISRNRKRANRLAKQFTKDFYIPKL